MATDVQFFIEQFVRFFDYVRISGGLYIPGRPVKEVAIVHGDTLLATTTADRPVHGVPCGFLATFTTPVLELDQLRLVFTLADGEQMHISGREAIDLYLQAEGAGQVCEKMFFDRIKAPGFDRVLEIGSRDRSNIVRRGLFAGKQYTGLDIVKGPNVDVVGDAHALSEYFEPESFDAIYSIATFEHLAMPWRVALEINKVLRTGGVAYFDTHQALGMHELPWDFWRYSDTAWNSLFNAHTGFRILETLLGGPMALVPHVYSDRWEGFEGAVGFSTSSVLVEKIGPTNMTWNVDVREVTKGFYPA